MKLKYADRPDWSRILEKDYKCVFIEGEHFCGYVAYLKLIKVREPLHVTYGSDQHLCIVDNNYVWLQFFPSSGNFMLTATFNAEGDLVQCYFDIVRKIAISENGIPYCEDLYLDVVALPSGLIFTLDEDELLEALEQGIITKAEYDHALLEGGYLKDSLAKGTNHLMNKIRVYCDFLKDI